MPTVRAGQIDLHVVDRGSGVPLVLVHGFPLDHSMWNEQINHFAAHHRVIAPDLRGFGSSQVAPGTSSMEQMADDLAALLDALAVHEQVVLCGLSMGGYVAFQFWRKYPGRLRALVLCDTRAIADTPEAAAGRHKTAEDVLANGPAKLADAMLPKLFAPDTLAKNAALGQSQRHVIERTAREGIAAALRGMAARPDVTGHLEKIAVPTLVVVGTHDAISTVDEMRGFSAKIPGATFVEIKDAGHMAPLENPQSFNEVLDGFLARLAGK